MTRRRSAALLLALLMLSLPAMAAEPCSGPADLEEFQFAWRLRGGLRIIAGLVFPTSGIATLKTTYPGEGGGGLKSELLITSSEGVSGGYYAYESEMDDAGERTVMTYHGYAWGKKSRKERIVLDYEKRLAKIHKETTKGTEYQVKKMPEGDTNLRDVLTAIHFLRKNALRLNAPLTTSIYSDGKPYPVVFQPSERRSFVVEGKTVMAREFDITDAPGGKKWPGGVSVWVTEDERRIPVRIVISQSMASLQLDVRSVRGCGRITP